MSRIHDISLPVRSGGLIYPGNPPIDIAAVQSVARGDSSNVSKICFGSHTATHVDASKHFFDDADGVDKVSLEKLVGPALVVQLADDVMSIGARELESHDLDGHTRILLKTRNSAYNHDTSFRQDFTYLAPDGASYLVDRGVELVGIDYLSIEQFHSGHHLTHRTLLEREVVIVEGLNLTEIQAGVYELVCLPLRIDGLDGAPARAILIER